MAPLRAGSVPKKQSKAQKCLQQGGGGLGCSENQAPFGPTATAAFLLQEWLGLPLLPPPFHLRIEGFVCLKPRRGCELSCPSVTLDLSRVVPFVLLL